MVKLIRFHLKTETVNAARTGLLHGDQVVDVSRCNNNIPSSMRQLLGSITALDALHQIQTQLHEHEQQHQSNKPHHHHPLNVKEQHIYPLSNVTLLAPIADPEKIICVGLNYKDHAAEAKMNIPPEPVLFSKFNTTICGPKDTIVIPSIIKEPDYEVELVIVIGKKGKNITEEEALSYVAGYTIGHDVSARDWQLKKAGGQWMIGKTFDTFAPIGPAIVTADEIPDPQKLAVKLSINGEVMQKSSTEQMIFPCKRLINYCSSVMTLLPGDLIFTGTPSGVGFTRQPPRFLRNVNFLNH